MSIAFSFRSCLAVVFCLVSQNLISAEDERPILDDSKLEKARPSALRSLWIVGDSTVKNRGEMRGWGQDVGSFLDVSKIQVVNHAIGGRSSRTFYNEGRWERVLEALKKGDIVLIQFGHNDGGPIDQRSKYRGSLRGIGDETEDIEKPDGSVETVRTYGWYLKYFARTAGAKGAEVILCSPIPHKRFDREGKFVQDWLGWREWVRSCADAEGAGFLDLAQIIGARYAEMDASEIESYFADKGTHTNSAGAMFNAKCVIEGLRSLPGDPLDGYLKDRPD